jgi:DNA-binding IclR family transcriptional regulator
MSQSVKRAARILGSVAAEPKPVAALAEEFGIHRSTTFRELQALEEVGFARRLADGRFAPGLQLAALGSAALEDLDLRDAAFGHVRRLYRMVGNRPRRCADRRTDGVPAVQRPQQGDPRRASETLTKTSVHTAHAPQPVGPYTWRTASSNGRLRP